ncbi:ficolin-1 [Culex quinquefasciatus]|uniref:Ficolin-1 n=1 Tax=Culex quinquefasciatus TaxID=7176 RepID=B0WHG1_CULQU|nr:ficolin-1 [Culex quinquefasciatus]|eukprot:XP_001848145.1 ficolin-1 [Culex quinquefasciatus]
MASTSGKYQLQLSSKAIRSAVYCDMDTFFGGWLVLQQRLDGSVNFTRTWLEYRNGFGTVGESTEFWLGLELLHQLTTSGQYELLIELKNEAGKYGYARYTDFRVATEEDKYRMAQLGEHSGTLPDDLGYHRNRKFSTFDQDNDDQRGESCALKLSTKSFPVSVYCDMESFLGGLLVIQQRTDGSVNFIRNWREYQGGFGTVGESSEFWLGLDTLHLVTSSAAYELVVELIDETGKYGFARYKDFKIAGEAEKYRMSALGEYSGTIGDGLRPHQNSKFSTFDQDNDLREGSCSVDYHSGAAWWYNNCGGR